MENKQKRSMQRKEQRDRVKQTKSDQEDKEVLRLAKEADCCVSPTQSLSTHVSEHIADSQQQNYCSSDHADHDINQLDLVENPDVDTVSNYEGNIDISQHASDVSENDDLSVQHQSDFCEDHDEPSISSTSYASSEDEPPSASAQFNCDLTELNRLLDEVQKAEADPDSDLKKKLAVWTVERNVVHRQVDSLLKILQSEGHPSLPSTCKTLLKTPRNLKDLLKPLGAGTLWYQGVLKAMQPYLSEEHLQDDTATIDVYIDGASPYKSVRLNLWPIVGRIVGSDPAILFIIAVWCGTTKEPADLDGFLRDFVNEAKEMMEGFPWNGRTMKLKIRRYGADAPARAFLKNVLAHNSYGSCERCCLHGQWKGRVVFPAQAGAEVRTDESFSTRLHAVYHKGVSPLEELDTRMISQFPLDGMHLLYLGVMKKLLKELLNEKKPGNHKINNEKKNELSAHLATFALYCPSEFSRKPRTLDDWKLLKAHELRRILLYDGVLLYSELPAIPRKNFLLFHCSVRILSDKKMRQYFKDADYLLKTFVKHAGSKDVYGPAFLVYNVHHLEHFAEECEKNGTVEEFSVFLNENFIGKLKDMLNTPGRTLEQIMARVFEQVMHLEPNHVKPPPLAVSAPHSSGPVLDLEGQQYQKICIEGMVLRPSLNDSCCYMKSGEVVVTDNFVKTSDGQIWVIGKPFHDMVDMYTYPISSSILGIFKVSRLLTHKKWHVEDIEHKCMLLPILKKNVATGSFCCMPMLQHW